MSFPVIFEKDYSVASVLQYVLQQVVTQNMRLFKNQDWRYGQKWPEKRDFRNSAHSLILSTVVVLFQINL
jgi:hypothetical protein